jgi:hypothetical protein
VASVVRELWSNGSSSSTAGIVANVQPAAAAKGSGAPLNLFKDPTGAFST